MPFFVPDATGRWQWTEPRMYVSGEWTSSPLTAKPTAFLGSPFWPRYMGEGTVMTRDVRGAAMPLAANSAASAAWMVTNLNAGSGFGPTGWNSSAYGTRPIPVWVVDSTQPGAQWQFIDSVSAGAGFNQASVDVYCKGRIPMPMHAAPASNGDKSMAIYDLGTGIMREYFNVQPVAGKAGHWTAVTGGWSVTYPGLERLAETNPGLQLRTGTSAAVGMHNPLGFIGIAEVIKGEIGHAVAFTCSNMGTGMSWPAISSDGISTDTDAPKEGQWCRLPASVDPDLNPATGQPYKPMTRLIIGAFKRYGGVATDKNLFVHAFNGESGEPFKAAHGVDPWASGGLIETALGGPVDVSDFPWGLTEWAPIDWGRPSPDHWLRRGEIRY